ncbi:MAG: DUF885 domain-containing protein [Phycisphaerales bacterium]|nr:DUF885 domain-containing protein [Phycisphaerales bacterium]
MRNLRLMAVWVGVAPAVGGAALGQEMDAKLYDLCHQWFEWQMAEFPEQAMARGDYRYADRVTDMSAPAIGERRTETEAYKVRLRHVDYTQLSDRAQLDHDVFDRMLDGALAEFRFQTFLYPVWGRAGPQQTIPEMADHVRFDRVEDYRNYLTRLEKMPVQMEQIAALMRVGMQKGYTPPQIIMPGIPAQIRGMVDGELQALGAPFEFRPAFIGDEEWEALAKRFREKSLPDVVAALRAFGEFVGNEYIPKCRASIAATALPDGKAFYEHRLRMFTTTGMPAIEIHELGLREVARIRAEMLGVIRHTDFMERHAGAKGLSDEELFRAFLKDLRTNPRFYFTDAETMLTQYRDICKRVDAWLPKFFRMLPRLPYGVRPIPEAMAPTQTTGYYHAGDIDNAEPGYFYVNTYQLDQRPKYEMIALAMHESVPGHHLQSALAQELDGVPEFRRDIWFNAFGEGWALYAERLGIEMGLYQDPYDDFGRLLYEMWRACRLVVDPGMHALGWSREQARQFMMENTALSELNVNTEIDRYIAWPGQATGYKIGELKIRELRAAAEAALKERFDVRGFHDVVLGAGSIPLDMLEERVESWMEAERSRPPESETEPSPPKLPTAPTRE